jgi:hypothetical protein
MAVFSVAFGKRRKVPSLEFFGSRSAAQARAALRESTACAVIHAGASGLGRKR